MINVAGEIFTVEHYPGGIKYFIKESHQISHLLEHHEGCWCALVDGALFVKNKVK